MLTNGHSILPGSVLIIENNQALREVLVELLDLADVTCLDTPSGCEGVNLFQMHQNDIDLVVMDMGLGDINGSMIVEELEAVRPHLKIIIISGQEKKKLDHLFAGHPNVSVVQKPFNTFEFLNIVTGQLGHGQPANQLFSKKQAYESAAFAL